MKTKLLRKLRNEANSIYKIGVSWHRNEPKFQVKCHKNDVVSEHNTITEAKDQLKQDRRSYILSRVQDIRYSQVLKLHKK